MVNSKSKNDEIWTLSEKIPKIQKGRIRISRELIRLGNLKTKTLLLVPILESNLFFLFAFNPFEF